jgi:hypothetical protein
MYPHILCSYRKRPVAICSLSIGEKFKELTIYSTYQKVVYCALHGYDLIMDESVHDPDRPPAWSKVLLLQKYLDKYEHLVWLDSDLYIMNINVKLENWIEDIMGEHDMFVSKDWKMINTGVWFIRNTDYMHTFLEKIYSNFLEHSHWEQESFIQLYDKNEDDIQNHCKIVYHTDINSYWFNYCHGHFIIHMCGCRAHSLLQEAMSQYCPVRKWVENESEESFQQRLEWLSKRVGDGRP